MSRERDLRIVDQTWKTATESESVPSTEWAERIIASVDAKLEAGDFVVRNAPIPRDLEAWGIDKRYFDRFYKLATLHGAERAALQIIADLCYDNMPEARSGTAKRLSRVQAAIRRLASNYAPLPRDERKPISSKDMQSEFTP